jgi:hypothetical protein
MHHKKRAPFTVAIEVCDLTDSVRRIVPVFEMRVYLATRPHGAQRSRTTIIPGEADKDYGLTFSHLPVSLSDTEFNVLCGRVLLARCAVADTVRSLFANAQGG